MIPGQVESTARVVVIVGGGFIGKTLAQVALESGRRVIVVTRSPVWTGPEVELVVGDAANADVIGPVLERARHVMLAHSGLQPAESQLEPVRDLQALLSPITTVFSLLADAAGVGVTLFSSGGTIYGDAHVVPTPETAPVAPRSFYGTNRWVAEEYVKRYARETNPVTVLRCANLYGPFQPAGRSQGLVAVVADRLRRSATLTIFGDGSTERDYVLASDVCRAALELALEAAPATPYRVLNCGSGVGTRTLDLVLDIAALLALEPRLTFEPDRGFDVQRSVLDITALRSLIRYDPTALDEGLRRTLQHNQG